MNQPKLSPKLLSPRQEVGARHVSGDDIDLPPLPVSSVASVESQYGRQAVVFNTPAVTPRLSRYLLVAGLVAAMAVGGWVWLRKHPPESASSNWNHAIAAKNASVAQRATIVNHRTSTGFLQLSRGVELSVADADPSLTLAVQALLAQNNLEGANAALQSGPQSAVETSAQTNVQRARPELRPNTRIVAAIRDGNSPFFQLRLFDCCAEDGDIVDLAINSEHYARVPLTHEGTVITLPLTPGTTLISLKGVHDGGGGITVSFQSSQGDFFCQPIAEGEEFQVGVVIR